jgi:hypothetical protein
LTILDFLAITLSFRPFTHMSMILSKDICNMTMIEFLVEMCLRTNDFINTTSYSFLFNNYTLNKNEYDVVLIKSFVGKHISTKNSIIVILQISLDKIIDI